MFKSAIHHFWLCLYFHHGATLDCKWQRNVWTIQINKQSQHSLAEYYSDTVFTVPLSPASLNCFIVPLVSPRLRGCYLLWVWGTRLPLWPRPPTWGCWAKEEDEEAEEEDGTEGLCDEGAEPPGRWLWCWWGLLLPPLIWCPRVEGSCCRLRMLSMAHCRCSFSESSGGLPLEKLALSMSGESDLQRLAGSKESRVKEDSGDGGPGACWSILNVPPALCRFFPLNLLYLLTSVSWSVCSSPFSFAPSLSRSCGRWWCCVVLIPRLNTSISSSPCTALPKRPVSWLESVWVSKASLSLFSTFTLAITVRSEGGFEASCLGGDGVVLG